MALTRQINSNMRCIEIKGWTLSKAIWGQINSNMRCIEIVIREIFGWSYMDKQ